MEILLKVHLDIDVVKDAVDCTGEANLDDDNRSASANSSSGRPEYSCGRRRRQTRMGAWFAWSVPRHASDNGTALSIAAPPITYYFPLNTRSVQRDSYEGESMGEKKVPQASF